MINVAMIGFGLSGRYLQTPFFIDNTDFELVSVVSSQVLPRDQFPKLHQFPDIDSLLKDSQIDLVSICSPNTTHYSYAKKALEAGKHVLVEKPVTATLDEAKDLFECAERCGKVLYVFQNRRFDSDFLTIRKIVDSGILGEVLSYEACWDRYKPLLNSKVWKEIPTPGSGLLYDLGAHLIDQSVCLFGKPKNVEGQVFTEREGSEIDDAFDLKLHYEKLKVTLKSSLMAKVTRPRYILNGTKGSFIKHGMDIQEDQLRGGLLPSAPEFGRELRDFDGIIKTQLKELDFYGKVETVKGDWGALFRNLAAVIKGESKPLIDPVEIINQLEIIEAVKF